MQKTSGWCSDTFTVIFWPAMFRYFFNKYRRKSIAIQKCSAMNMCDGSNSDFSKYAQCQNLFEYYIGSLTLWLNNQFILFTYRHSIIQVNYLKHRKISTEAIYLHHLKYFTKLHLILLTHNHFLYYLRSFTNFGSSLRKPNQHLAATLCPLSCQF